MKEGGYKSAAHRILPVKPSLQEGFDEARVDILKSVIHFCNISQPTISKPSENIENGHALFK